MVAVLFFCFSEHYCLPRDMDCPIGPTILMDIILPRSSKYNHSPYVAGEEN